MSWDESPWLLWRQWIDSYCCLNSELNFFIRHSNAPGQETLHRSSTYVLNWLDAVSTLPKHRLMMRTVHFALRRLPNVVRESLNNLLLSFWEKRLWTSVSSGVRLQIKETSSWKLWELRWPRCVPGSSMLCSLKEGLCSFREFVSEIF